jgi:cation diffusion facilitator CzcD-associated flavoprotein CzcO
MCIDITRVQLADWFESYAHSLELDVWTSSTVTRASQDPETKKWTVEIERSGLGSRTLVVNHLVFAVGFGGGTHNMPQLPGAVCVPEFILIICLTLRVQEEFKGTIVHSGHYTKAKDYEGKKVIVVGACTSGIFISVCAAYNFISTK